MTNKKLIDLESLDKFAKDFNNEIDKKFNAELEIKADKSELFSGDYNDLTNKPCYETSELKLFTNDGDNTGRLIVNVGTTNGRFAKISEDVIDFNSVDQVRLSMTVGDEAYEFTDQLDPSTFVIVENETGSAISLAEYVICTFNDNFTMQMSGTGDPIVTFPEKGLYFAFNVGSGHVWRLDNVYLPIVSAKQLDEKFIPDTIARMSDVEANLLAKDYGDTILVEVPAEKLLEEIEKAKAEGDKWVYFDWPNFEVDPNQEYYIEFDNKIQKMVIEDDYYEGLCLGIFPNYDYEWNDDKTKMLFEIWPEVTDNYTSENITSIIIKQRNIKQIDKKYISDNFEALNSISMGRYMFSETGYHSTAIGSNCIASGVGSFASGENTSATGDLSHAEGSSTEASGYLAHTEGHYSIALGSSSHAEGSSTIAGGHQSHAEGNYTVALGSFSHSEGRSNGAFGDGAHSEGYGGQSAINSDTFPDTAPDDITNEMALAKWKSIMAGATFAVGYGAHAEGRSTLAAGDGAHSEGAFTAALNRGTHSEGINTTAIGNGAHTEGYSSYQAPDYFDEGTLINETNENIITKWKTKNFLLAKGEGAHAEGKDTLALGRHSHTEGFQTKALDDYAHAEGCCTEASEAAAHAEGDTTKATGTASHAEGYVTEASGYAAHAEGQGTIASWDAQHVEGSYNIEDTEGEYLHIVGNGSVYTRSNAHTIDWDGNAWFAGKATVSAQPTENNDLTTKEYVDNAISQASIGGEVDTSGFALKTELFSKDYNDLTNKPFYDSREYEDVVIEYDGNNEGRTMCSIPAMGLSTAYKVADLTAEQLEQYKASCADGFTLTYLKGDGSTEVVQSSVIYSFMGDPVSLYAGGIGQVFLSAETFSTEIGHADNYVNEAGVYFKENTGTNPYKVIKLEFKNVSGELKTIDPQFLTNSPGIKVEEGKSYISEYNSQTYVAQNNAEIFNDTRNMATGQCSHAEGAKTEAHGSYSHAEGYSTYAIGSYSHAEGGFAKAIGEYSHTEGAYTKATGNYSHAEGYNNDAIGAYSHAEGNDNEATGECSHVEGYKTTAAGKWQHVQGVYNIEDTENKYAHIVGNGDYMYGGSGPSNAHTLDWDGNAWFAGDVFIKGTSQDDAQKLATEDMVNNAINNIKIPEGFSGSYNDLTNKPEIPSIEGLASETYVNEAIAGIVDSAPETLDTLNELAQALGDDPNFATTIATEIGTKASTEFVNNMLSGLRLVQMTQSEYDALEVKDSNTLYIII